MDHYGSFPQLICVIMKIVKFMGGLGNQMFQHAFLVALRESCKEPIYIDLSDYERYKQHNGYELGRIFEIKNPIARTKDIWKYTCLFRNKFLYYIYTKLSILRPSDIKERHSYLYHPEIISKHKDGYYDGFWQCYLYFHKYRELIAKEFTFPAFSESKNIEAAAEINNDQKPVCIHVRRGDYLKTDMYKGICELDYYKDSIEYVKKALGEGVSFYIFSNDIEWCTQNIFPLTGSSKTTFVSWNVGKKSYRDLQLMTLFRGCIVANSSFSWWAAYLNNREDKLIVAPKKWVNSPIEYKMQLPDWILI